MTVIRPGVLLFAAAMAAPALWRAFVTGELDVTSALTRFLLAVPAAVLMLAALRFVTAGYGRAKASTATPARRRTDHPPADAVPDPPA
jgi:hypothetical protein